MRFVRFLVRMLGVAQWLAGMTIGAICVALQVQTLEEAGGSTASGVGADIVNALAPAVVSANMTIPGLLLAILLLLSANYCGMVGRPRSGHRPPDRRGGTPPPDSEPLDEGVEDGDVPTGGRT